MNQTDLFQPPASHKGDPMSSFKAEKIAPVLRETELLHALLEKHAPCTMRELSDKTGFDYSNAQKRISVLEKNHLARRRGFKKNPKTNQDNQVWSSKCN